MTDTCGLFLQIDIPDHGTYMVMAEGVWLNADGSAIIWLADARRALDTFLGWLNISPQFTVLRATSMSSICRRDPSVNFWPDGSLREDVLSVEQDWVTLPVQLPDTRPLIFVVDHVHGDDGDE